MSTYCLYSLIRCWEMQKWCYLHGSFNFVKKHWHTSNHIIMQNKLSPHHHKLWPMILLKKSVIFLTRGRSMGKICHSSGNLLLDFCMLTEREEKGKEWGGEVGGWFPENQMWLHVMPLCGVLQPSQILPSFPSASPQVRTYAPWDPCPFSTVLICPVSQGRMRSCESPALVLFRFATPPLPGTQVTEFPSSHYKQHWYIREIIFAELEPVQAISFFNTDFQAAPPTNHCARARWSLDIFGNDNNNLLFP